MTSRVITENQGATTRSYWQQQRWTRC